MAVLVASLAQLREEFNALAPARDKASDGWIGDARHAATASDHNPDESGRPEVRDADSVDEVHAIDVDRDLRVSGLDMARVVAFVLARCRSGAEKRLRYVIYNRVIWSASWGWQARTYSGSNPHTAHAHFSASYGSAHEADRRPWGLAQLLQVRKPAPAPSGVPAVKLGSRTLRDTTPDMRGTDVAYVQRWIGQARAGAPDGVFGARTAEGVRWYQRMRGLAADGIVGTKTWAAMGVRR